MKFIKRHINEGLFKTPEQVKKMREKEGSDEEIISSLANTAIEKMLKQAFLTVLSKIGYVSGGISSFFYGLSRDRLFRNTRVDRTDYGTYWWKESTHIEYTIDNVKKEIVVDLYFADKRDPGTLKAPIVSIQYLDGYPMIEAYVNGYIPHDYDLTWELMGTDNWDIHTVESVANKRVHDAIVEGIGYCEEAGDNKMRFLLEELNKCKVVLNKIHMFTEQDFDVCIDFTAIDSTMMTRRKHGYESCEEIMEFLTKLISFENNGNLYYCNYENVAGVSTKTKKVEYSQIKQ